MAEKCVVCGCEGPEMFTAGYREKEGTYCNISCLVHDLADRCNCCGCVILGHVFTDAEGNTCCCEICAEKGKQ